MNKWSPEIVIFSMIWKNWNFEFVSIISIGTPVHLFEYRKECTHEFKVGKELLNSKPNQFWKKFEMRKKTSNGNGNVWLIDVNV